MSKQRSRSPRTSGGSRGQEPSFLLYAWFHPEIVPGLRCWRCHERPGVVRFDDYYSQPTPQELLSMPLEEAAERLFAALLAEQAALGPRVHHSEPYCFACTRQHLDAIFGGPSARAGLKAIVAMQGLAGHPGVAVLQDTSTATNIMLITLERTLEGLFRQLADTFPDRARA
jgi:hypothetical protein